MTGSCTSCSASSRRRRSGRSTEEAAAMTGRYLEDFAVGQTFGSGRLRVDKERIKAFAAAFDPQSFLLVETAGSRVAFGGEGLDPALVHPHEPGADALPYGAVLPLSR